MATSVCMADCYKQEETPDDNKPPTDADEPKKSSKSKKCGQNCDYEWVYYGVGLGIYTTMRLKNCLLIDL